MIRFAMALLAPLQTVTIATPRGVTSIPLSAERGAPAIAVSRLTVPLGLTAEVSGGEAAVRVGGVTFVFELGAPFVRAGEAVCGLVAEPYLARDTLFLPLVWLTDCLPRAVGGGRYRWDADAGRLAEAAPLVVTPVLASTVNPITGLRLRHTIVVDPGHGGRDPGNPGRYFSGSLTEKDITLAIGRLLRAELTRRGLTAVLTRTGDTLVDLHDRPGYCAADCDLFVSIHVNAMPAGRRASVASGVETYFLSDAKTEDQRRVADMENAAIRFEADAVRTAQGPLSQIIRDLQQNEYLRESARLAELVQGRVAGVHPGGDRGVQQAGFWVLNFARRPAILVETGFATNKDDGAFLTSALGQRKIANAIADGIVAYLQELERKLAVGGVGR